MGDFTVDDLLFDHPKALAAGEDATNLYVRGLAWASRHNTGLIPKPAVRTLTAKANHAALAARLTHIAPGCTEPLWHDRGDHYEINDWATRNALRASRREAGKRGAKARWQTPPFANGKTGDVPHAKTPVLPDGRIEVGQCQDKEKDKDVVSSSSKLTVVPKPPDDDEPDIATQAIRLLAEQALAGTPSAVGNPAAWLAKTVEERTARHATTITEALAAFTWTPEQLARHLEPEAFPKPRPEGYIPKCATCRDRRIVDCDDQNNPIFCPDCQPSKETA